MVLTSLAFKNYIIVLIINILKKNCTNWYEDIYPKIKLEVKANVRLYEKGSTLGGLRYEKKKINNIEFSSTLFLILFSCTLGIAPYITIKIAGIDSYIGSIIGSIIGLIPLFIFYIYL